MSQTQLTNDPTAPDLPRNLPFQKGKTNRQLLKAAQEAAGVNIEWPIDTHTAFLLLRIIGYDADRPRFNYHLKANYINAPTRKGNAFQWSKSDVIAFADSLESTRSWLALHPCHVHKLTEDECTKHALEGAKKAAALQAFKTMHANELVNRLVNTECKDTRELLAFALKSKLALHLRGDQTPTDHHTEDN